MLGWVLDKEESKIARVNAIQALSDMAVKEKKYMKEFQTLLLKVETENIPSINARVRKLKY